MNESIVVTRLDDGRDILFDKKRLGYFHMDSEDYRTKSAELPINKKTKGELARIYAANFTTAASLTRCTFILSLKCNMKCSYCYQKKVPLDRKALFSPEKIDAAFGFLSQAGSTEKVKIHVSGGEPLLAENETALGRLLERARERGYSVDITTNGINLGIYKELLSRFPEVIRKLNVSIDGDPETHAQSRGNPAIRFDYKDVMLQCKSIADFTQIRFNITVDRSIPDLAKGILKLYKAFSGIPSVSFGITQKIDMTDDNPMGYSLDEEQFSWYERLWESLDADDRQRTVISLPLLEWFLSVTKNDETIPLPTSGCDIGKSSILFFPDGSVYPCEMYMHKPDSALGTFYPEINTSPLYAALKKKTILDSEKCIGCENIFLCGGGCQYNANLQGTGEYAKSYNCGVFTADGDEYIKRLTLFLSRTMRKDYFANLR